MDIYTIQEEAYKRGYEQGKKDATEEREEVVCNLRKKWMAAQTLICTMCGHFDHKTDGNIVYGNLMCGELVGYPCCGKFTPWIPVTERLPENDYGNHWKERQYYLVCLDNGLMMVATFGFKEYGWWIDSHSCVLDKKHYTEVTHWMPLPEPPKGE